MDIEQFRKDFPEFKDVDRFPVSAISFWSTMGAKLISEPRWGDLYTTALQLFTAHNITLEANDVKTANAGGAPGSVTGAVSSKTVGRVSISYINEAAMEADAGYLNATSYGRRYHRLVRLLGGGCYQL